MVLLISGGEFYELIGLLVVDYEMVICDGKTRFQAFLIRVAKFKFAFRDILREVTALSFEPAASRMFLIFLIFNPPKRSNNAFLFKLFLLNSHKFAQKLASLKIKDAPIAREVSSNRWFTTLWPVW